MKAHAIAAAVLLCAACVSSDDEDEVHVDPTLDEVEVVETLSAAAPDICEPAPDAEGACALVCDPEALLETYVPEGTCAIFECVLADGSPARGGGCR